MKIGIVDTMFSRVNMGQIAIDELKAYFQDVSYVRTTVPGIKDLAVECKKHLDSGCDVALALGMVGGAPIDTQCAHEASLGIQQAKLMTNKHIIEVFIHENEAWSEAELSEIFQNRTRKHVHNAVLLVKNPALLLQFAGLGMRQGKHDEGTMGKVGPLTFGLVVGYFNDELTLEMELKAKKIAAKENVLLRIVRVPGVYDMPLAAKKFLTDKSIDAVVSLGAVVKGETTHDEVITKDTARRLGDLSLEFKKPVTLGIIGPDASWEVAKERAGPYAQRAVMAAIEMVKVLRN